MTPKEKITEGFLNEIKKISLGPTLSNDNEINNLVIMSSKNFIKLNPNITIDDLNNFIKNNGNSKKYDSFVDFFIEFYNVKSTKIIKEYLPELQNVKLSLPLISFSETDNHTILINV